LLEYQEVIETNGIKIPFVPAIITPKIERPMRNSRYEGGECMAVRELLKPGDRVLELGAGVGLLSSVAALGEGVESVTAIEANPQLIDLIRETHRLNGIDNVDLRNGVVSAEKGGTVDFFIRPDFWGSSMEGESRPFLRKESLPNFNFGDLVKEISPTIIVCDIEGAELGLFDKVDLSGVRNIILETHPKVYGAGGVDSIFAALAKENLSPIPIDNPSSVRCFERTDNAKSIFDNVINRMPTRNYAPWNDSDPKVMIATCMKDEGPFILEWIAWHKSIGVTDFVVFTNDCSDGTDEILDRLEDMGVVKHLPNPAIASDSTFFQPSALAYTHALRNFRECDFFISIDVDEFINIRTHRGKFNDLLKKTGPFDVLTMCELNHGSNLKEHYELGMVTEQFPLHQSIRPGKWKARRGVKSIVRLGNEILQVRNHRPDTTSDALWFDGSGNPDTYLRDNREENGTDCRGKYDLVVLEHYPLRSLESYLVKMFRGDVVVKGKMVSERYWRTRDQNEMAESSLTRQQASFRKTHRELLVDAALAELHHAACQHHTNRIAELIETPLFSERRDWIFKECWNR